MAGKNAMFIKEWMGHSSVTMTERYTHLSAGHLDSGIAALEGFTARHGAHGKGGKKHG
jgi:integrase